jgi:hypothetical protein
MRHHSGLCEIRPLNELNQIEWVRLTARRAILQFFHIAPGYRSDALAGGARKISKEEQSLKRKSERRTMKGRTEEEQSRFGKIHQAVDFQSDFLDLIFGARREATRIAHVSIVQTLQIVLRGNVVDNNKTSVLHALFLVCVPYVKA